VPTPEVDEEERELGWTLPTDLAERVYAADRYPPSSDPEALDTFRAEAIVLLTALEKSLTANASRQMLFITHGMPPVLTEENIELLRPLLEIQRQRVRDLDHYVSQYRAIEAATEARMMAQQDREAAQRQREEDRLAAERKELAARQEQLWTRILSIVALVVSAAGVVASIILALLK